MLKTFRSWLRPPVFSDQAKTHEAFLLHVILWSLVVVPIPYVLGSLWRTPQFAGRALLQGTFGEAINCVLLVLLHRGAVRLASVLQVTAFFAFMTATAATLGGVQSPAYQLGYSLVIVIAGVLLGARGAAVATLVSLVSGFYLWQRVGLAQSLDAPSIASIWIVSAVIFPVLAVVQYLASRTVHLALARASLSEQKYRGYLENAPTGVFVADREGRLIEVNEGIARITGWSRAELLQMKFGDLVVAEERADFERQLSSALQNGKLHAEISVPDTRGQTHHLSVAAIRMSDSLLLAFASDLSGRRRAELALRESENRFRMLADASFEGIIVHDGGVIVEANQRFAELFGYEKIADLIGVNGFAHLLTPESARTLSQQVQRGSLSEMEVVGVRRDGSTFPGETQSRAMEYEGKARRVVAMRDITERKRAAAEREQLQRRLSQSQRLESIGRLAGGVAHDFNNLLTAIMGNVSLLQQEWRSDAGVSDRLSEVMHAAEGAARLTRQLLAVGQKQIASPTLLDPNQVIDATERLILRLLGDPVHFETDLDASVGNIFIDPGQFEQILVNLCVNARDAMPKGGKLLMRTDLTTLGPDDARAFADAAPGEFVRISVSDTGIGMSGELLAHVFEPFFTTKQVGQGTGLGLATVHGIVQQNRGFIRISSEVAKGTRFEVCLPRASEAP